MATLLSLPAPSCLPLLKQEVCPAQLISSENAGVTLPFPSRRPVHAVELTLAPAASSPTAPGTHSLDPHSQPSTSNKGARDFLVLY